MGSKMIGFRCPDDLAEEFARYCEGADKTSGEVLRRLVDEMLYPGSDREAELGSPERLYGIAGTEKIVELVNAQVKEQIDSQLGPAVDERLELVQVDRALTEAEKERYEASLANLGSELANLKAGVSALVKVVDDNVEAYEGTARTVNSNVGICNKSFDRLSRLFQLLDAHSHDDGGKVELDMRSERLLRVEVEEADGRVGELPGTLRSGKVDKPGWKYLELTKKSIKRA